jgi:hypothetical protein
MAINRELIGQIAFKREQIFNRENYDFMDVPKVRLKLLLVAPIRVSFLIAKYCDYLFPGSNKNRHCHVFMRLAVIFSLIISVSPFDN